MTELSPQPNIAPPAPPPGAILPPGFVPPAGPPPGYVGGPGPARPLPPGVNGPPGFVGQPGPVGARGPVQQPEIDPQSIKIQAAITELEQQCNAVRSRCMAQAADIALQNAIIERLKEQVQSLGAERDHYKAQAEAATAVEVSSEPVE